MHFVPALATFSNRREGLHSRGRLLEPVHKQAGLTEVDEAQRTELPRSQRLQMAR